MKKVEQYQCEICERYYETEELATKCENAGIENDWAKEKEMVKVKAEYGSHRAGRIVSIETKGHEKHYTIGVYPQGNGMHFNYEKTLIVKGNKEASKQLMKYERME